MDHVIPSSEYRVVPSIIFAGPGFANATNLASVGDHAIHLSGNSAVVRVVHVIPSGLVAMRVAVPLDDATANRPSDELHAGSVNMLNVDSPERRVRRGREMVVSRYRWGTVESIETAVKTPLAVTFPPISIPVDRIPRARRPTTEISTSRSDEAYNPMFDRPTNEIEGAIADPFPANTFPDTMFPETCSGATGVAVPIPTFP